MTPSSRSAAWILRSPNRRWWLAVVLVPAYLVIAHTSWTSAPASDGAALVGLLVTAWAAWNAAKFAIVTLVVVLRRPGE